MNKAKWVLPMLVGVAVITAGCGSSGNGGGGQTAPSDVPTAFSKNCSACHGSALEGKSGPNLTKVGGKLSEDQIKTKIQKGATGMPGFEKTLSADEVNSLSTWLASKK